MNDVPLDLPPYEHEVPPRWWEVHAQKLAAALVFATTIALTVIMFPPFDMAEFAYAFAVPALLWAYRRPGFKTFALVVLGANAVAWTLLLSWLHHVTWGGLFLLGPFVGLWVGSWYLAAWWLMPRLLGRPAPIRILGIFALAALWVLIEWTRTWFLSGFPWLPLSASQWQRTSILQIAAFSGAWGVSFVLVALNAGFAAYAHRLLFERLRGLRKRSQEFFAAMFLLIICLSVHVQETFNRGQFNVPWARVGFVQPDIAQEIKWDPTRSMDVLATLRSTTLKVAGRLPDLILWPEAVTPWAVERDPQLLEWTNNLTKQANRPILFGSLAMEGDSYETGKWFNAVYLSTPEGGVESRYYAKRKRVPFGEYVPLRPVLGWLDKVVPVGGDLTPGDNASPLIVPIGRNFSRVAPLVCYEDIFPSLALDSVRAGADVFTVHTNNAWFGRGGAAYQHAAHAVLRAVETRRPVLRVGNAGWSGWIDEFGNVRKSLVNQEGSIYFRGVAAFDVTRDFRWIDQPSFYVRHPYWFLITCFVLVVFGWAGIRYSVAEELPAGPESDDVFEEG